MVESERPRRRPRPRLESLSDLIYGLSLSIGAISLVITGGGSSSEGDIIRNILEFIFVFLILITSWIIYTSDMSVLPIENRLVTFLNVVLLVIVAIFPYLFDQVVSTINTASVQEFASILFAIDYAGMLFIATVMAHVISQEKNKLVDHEIMIKFRRSRNMVLVMVVIVLVSLAVPWDWTLFGVHDRLFIWYVPMVTFWSNRMRTQPYGIPHGAYRTE